MASIASTMWDLSTGLITWFTPDFFQIFYTGFVLFVLYTATWMLSVKIGDATLVNFLWGIGFSLQSLIYFYKSLEYSIFTLFTEKLSLEKLTFSIIVFAHGLRISAYLILREAGKGEDPRIKKLRDKLGENFWWASYFVLFLPQLIINMLMGSVIFAFANIDKGFIAHFAYWVGIVTMMFGGLLSTFADIQKYMFFTYKRNEGKILDKGLWGISRHPNYLGEVIFWWGVYLVNFSAGILWTIICPLIQTFLIIFVTGIPLNERMLKEEHGKDYEEYARKVPVFIPYVQPELIKKVDYDYGDSKTLKEDINIIDKITEYVK